MATEVKSCPGDQPCVILSVQGGYTSLEKCLYCPVCPDILTPGKLGRMIEGWVERPRLPRTLPYIMCGQGAAQHQQQQHKHRVCQAATSIKTPTENLK